MAKAPVRRPASAGPDESDATRDKLLEAAGQVFAEQGFQAATIREICSRAGANVAAINYHFRDKLGLYTEVLRRSIDATQHQALHQALSESSNPEEALRRFVGLMLQRMSAGQQATVNLRIMAHEIARPTPALSHVVKQMIGPNYDLLRGIISQILDLPPDHDTTRLCAHSLIGQVIHYVHARPVLQMLWPGLQPTPERQEQIANHIATFTLCSLHALAKQHKELP